MGLLLFERLCLLMDCGGSNSYRSRVFKLRLARFVEGKNFKIEASRVFKLRLARFVEGKNFKIEAHHYPLGTSKYNPIEHRMFPHCSRALQSNSAFRAMHSRASFRCKNQCWFFRFKS